MLAPGGATRGLSAAELAAALGELQVLAGATVVDVVGMRPPGGDDDLLLVLRTGTADAKTFVHVALGGARARITTTSRRFGKDAFVRSPALATASRHLTEATLRRIVQTPGERACELQFSSAGGDRRLVIELFGARGLWALLDAEGIAVALSREVETAVRTLRTGDLYVAPPVMATPRADPPPRFAPPVLASIDAAFSADDRAAEIAAEHDRCLRGLRRALTSARDKAAGLGAQLADVERTKHLREQADMMLAFAHTVPRGAASMTFPDPVTGDPRTIELDPSRPVTVQARAVYEKARRLDDGRETAVRRLAEAERTEAALAAIEARLLAVDQRSADASHDLAAIATDLRRLGALPRAPGERRDATRPRAVERAENFRRYVSAEGYPILVGRDDEQNDRLTMRFANGNDLWLHVGGGRPGSHVVVRLPKQKTASLETLLDAAALAVHFSKARGEVRIEVVYTAKKHVRKPKGAAPGAVVPTQTKTIVSLLDEARLRRLLDSSQDS